MPTSKKALVRHSPPPLAEGTWIAKEFLTALMRGPKALAPLSQRLLVAVGRTGGKKTSILTGHSRQEPHPVAAFPTPASRSFFMHPSIPQVEGSVGRLCDGATAFHALVVLQLNEVGVDKGSWKEAFAVTNMPTRPEVPANRAQMHRPVMLAAATAPSGKPQNEGVPPVTLVELVYNNEVVRRKRQQRRVAFHTRVIVECPRLPSPAAHTRARALCHRQSTRRPKPDPHATHGMLPYQTPCRALEDSDIIGREEACPAHGQASPPHAVWRPSALDTPMQVGTGRRCTPSLAPAENGAPHTGP